MLKNYLIITLRNFARNKAYTSINVLGLSLGMMCALLIFLWIHDESTQDAFHTNGPYLFSVYERRLLEGEIKASRETPGPLAEELKKSIPEVQYATSFMSGIEIAIQYEDKIFKMSGGYAQTDFFRMFTFPLVIGSPESVFANPNAMAISRRMAGLFFGTPENALGKIVNFANMKEFTVSSVFENTLENSSRRFDYLVGEEGWTEMVPLLKKWEVNAPETYVQLHLGTHAGDVEAKIRNFLTRYLEPKKDLHVELALQKFDDLYLYNSFENGRPTAGRIEFARIFGGIAVFILLIGCINYMNLATAQSLRRSKEISMRKVIGAARKSIITQFMSETIVLTLLALAISLVAAFLLLPPFNQLTGKQLVMPFNQSWFWGAAMTLVVVTGVLAGSYPSFFLASFAPIRLLKGLKFSSSAVFFRKGLVVFQFCISVILIIVTIVVSRQVNFIHSKSLGFELSNLIYTSMDPAVVAKYATVKERLLSMPGIAGVDRTGGNPIDMTADNLGIEWEGKEPGSVIQFANMRVGYDYVDVMKLQLVAGRAFSRDFLSDTASYLVNEEAVSKMGYRDPLGKKVTLFGVTGPIIGVLKDFHFHSLHEPIKPLMIGLNEKMLFGLLVIRTEPGRNKEAIVSLEKVLESINPNFPVTFHFADVEYQNLYKSEQIISKLTNIFGSLAVFISCLGLLGLARFTAEQRVKEIGIRKVLGASSANILKLFSREFLILVALAFAIASPVAWYIAGTWLEGYAYRVNLSWWIFAMGGACALFFSFITVSTYAIKSSLANPINSLRSE